MTKLFLCFILGGYLTVCFSQHVVFNNPVVLLQRYQAAEQIYQQAEKTPLQPGDTVARTYAHQLYQQALSLFQKLIPLAQQAGYDSLVFCLYHKAGTIYSKQDNIDSALAFYKKAEQVNNNYTYPPGKNHRMDSLTEALHTQYGLLLKYKGDQLAVAGRHYEAIQQYHQAIMQFDTSYNTWDIYSNPDQFNPGISFVHLFNTLIAKAGSFEQLQAGKKNIKALNAASDAYRAAFLVAEFVKKTHDPDEARLFPDTIIYFVQNRSIKLNLDLFQLTEQKKYLEEAYLFDQRYKSFSLLWDTVSVLQQKKLTEYIPSASSLQQLIDKRTAILSFHVSGNELLTFVITRIELGYHSELLPQDFLTNINSFRLSLYNGENQGHYNPTIGMKLYETLISPIHPGLKGIRRLIIIPDNELHHLPFEALQDNNEKYLLEEFSVQYQYSTALLGRQTNPSTDSIRLVITSAYDTMDSQLNNSMMNIPEAFTFAGRPNRITSLWKAEDKVTMYITKQLYQYMDEGYSRDKALQKARLDLLRSDEFESRFKTPVYWANMILIGEYEPPYNPTPWLLIAIIASVIAAVVWVITVKSNY